MDFGYLMTAMVTPFTNENALDVNGIRTLINHLAKMGRIQSSSMALQAKPQH